MEVMSDSEKKRCPHDGGRCGHRCETGVHGEDKCFREEELMYSTRPDDGYPLPGHEFPPGGEAIVLAVVTVRKRTRGGLGGCGSVTTYSGHIEISGAAEPERDQVASEKTHPRMLVQPLVSALGALLREKI